MEERSSGESMSHIIEVLSNKVFENFISKVDYIEGATNCSDVYLAHVNNYMFLSPLEYKDTFIVYKINEEEKLLVSSNKYYETIKKYLYPNLPVLLVGIDPDSQEMCIIQ